MSKWERVFVRTAQHQLDLDQINNQTKAIAEAATARKQYGFAAKVKLLPIEKKNGLFIYRAKVNLTRPLKRKRGDAIEVGERYFENALQQMVSRAQSRDWFLVDDDGVTSSKPLDIHPDLDFKLPPLNDEVFKTVFGRIYNRAEHIRTLYASVDTSVHTKMKKRRHCLLYGLPGCGKSEILQCFANWFNTDRERVLSIDATTASKAGIERLILDKAIDGTLPLVVYLEEVEKHSPQNLLCLLQVMDSRGRISRTNARIGAVSAKAEVIIWATCNDYQKFRSFEGGSLLSRFSVKMYCNRPNVELMKKIVYREIGEMDINPKNVDALVDKVVKFGFEEIRSSDPRDHVTLLDGWRNIDKYLEDQREILRSKEKDAAFIEMEKQNEIII